MTSTTDAHAPVRPSRAARIAGWLLTAVIAVMLVPSSLMKMSGTSEVVAGFAHLGIPAEQVSRIAALELACVLIFLIPHTAVLGALLLTGYMGGAIVLHVRLGEPFMVQLMIGAVAWAGIWLREPRLRRLLPLRRA
jgi:hypothetical protein